MGSSSSTWTQAFGKCSGSRYMDGSQQPISGGPSTRGDERPTTRNDSVAEILVHDTGQIFIHASGRVMTAGRQLATLGTIMGSNEEVARTSSLSRCDQCLRRIKGGIKASAP